MLQDKHDILFSCGQAGMVVQRAFWLTEEQKEIIAQSMNHPKLQTLTIGQKDKLQALLCCIPYAEHQVRRRGKTWIRNLEKVLAMLGIKRLFCRSLGTWNMHVCHAQRFGYAPQKFKAALENDQLAVEFVIGLILDEIGLAKPASHILAEYNHNIHATTVAALQRGLNGLLSKNAVPLKIEEDGLIGVQTWQALDVCRKYTNLSLSLPLSEKEMLEFLGQLASSEGIEVTPFIPQVQIRMDRHFVKQVLTQSINNPRALKKIWHVLQDHINVPLYVDLGMEAYTYISR